jgi:hypothetical protein
VVIGPLSPFIDYFQRLHQNLSEVESAAMWKLYSGAEGVAIQSNVGHLQNVFREVLAVDGGGMARVQYSTFEPSALPTLRLPAFYKHRSFLHESELRLVKTERDIGRYPHGVPVTIDPDLLLRGIFVSPLVPWLRSIVDKELCVHGLHNFSVLTSEIRSLG